MNIAIHDGYEEATTALTGDEALSGFDGKKKRRKGKRLKGAQRKFAKRARACGRKARKARKGKWSKRKFLNCMKGKR